MPFPSQLHTIDKLETFRILRLYEYNSWLYFTRQYTKPLNVLICKLEFPSVSVVIQ